MWGISTMSSELFFGFRRFEDFDEFLFNFKGSLTAVSDVSLEITSSMVATES